MSSIKDEYEKQYIIGKGSYATIWKARHRELGYVRALKMSNQMVEDESDPAYQSFLNECKVLLKIGNGSHPNIVHIYQPRLIENRAVVEMDYVDGETLCEYLEREHFMPIDEVYKFINDIVGALAYCHYDIYRYLMNPNEDDLKNDPNDGHKYIIDEITEQRLVEKYAVTHNDLHSNNVMRRNYDGSYMLLDFGLAITNGKAVKSSGRRGGALEYMSPEKFNKKSIISTQSDIYSLGVLLFEVLAGRVPFVLDKQSFADQPEIASYNMMLNHTQGIPPSIEPLRREAFEKTFPGQTYVKDFPDELESIILRCLEKDPSNRYSNAKELYVDFKKKCKMIHIENIDRLQTENDDLNKKLSHAKGQITRLKNEKKELLEENLKNSEKLKVENEEILSLNKLLKDTNKRHREWKFITAFFVVISIILGIMLYHYANTTNQLQQAIDEEIIKATNDSTINHIEYVDLGLPSGTKWKTANEDGFYNYQEAIHKFGTKLPNIEQIDELIRKCDWYWDSIEKGCWAEGINGESVFFPVTGDIKCDGTYQLNGIGGYLWCLTSDVADSAYYFYYNSEQVGFGYGVQCIGMSIRLVQN